MQHLQRKTAAAAAHAARSSAQLQMCQKSLQLPMQPATPYTTSYVPPKKGSHSASESSRRTDSRVGGSKLLQVRMPPAEQVSVQHNRGSSSTSRNWSSNRRIPSLQVMLQLQQVSSASVPSSFRDGLAPEDDLLLQRDGLSKMVQSCMGADPLQRGGMQPRRPAPRAPR